jgi:hypothetical protein
VFPIHENHPVGTKLFHAITPTDEQADVTKLIVSFAIYQTHLKNEKNFRTNFTGTNIPFDRYKVFTNPNLHVNNAENQLS